MMLSRFAGVIAALVFIFCATAAFSQSPKVIEPTKEQLEVATKAFATIKGRLLDPGEENPPVSVPIFFMTKATDDDLKQLPAVPFSFGLYLSRTKITQVGLKKL